MAPDEKMRTTIRLDKKMVKRLKHAMVDEKIESINSIIEILLRQNIDRIEAGYYAEGCK